MTSLFCKTLDSMLNEKTKNDENTFSAEPQRLFFAEKELSNRTA